MLGGLIYFLIGALVIVVVLAVVHLVMKYIPMDEPVKRIAWLVIGLIALIALILLAVNAFGLGGRW